MNLTSSQWSLVEPLIVPDSKRRGRGRPSQDARAVLDGVLWVVRTGAQWADLPERYPPYQTCHRHFRQWLKSGALVECLRLLAADLKGQSVPVEPGLEDVGGPSVQMAVRSWRRNTLLLLESPGGRAVLSAGGFERVR